MGKIRLMDPKTYGLIAAGEVVERPVSVVKELIENSIDAKATSIKIYLKNGGIDEILLIDDGEGMDKDDILSSFLPHATSKIKNSYDLQRIMTLGFRGEAISSISLVSKMTITSSVDGINGYFVCYKDGVKIDEGIANINKGTKVRVENLFLSTPARLKYLKSDKKELASILFLVSKLAISNKNIAFELYNDDKLSFKTDGKGDYKSLIAKLYGLNEAKNIAQVDYKLDGYHMNVIFIKPEFYRSTKLEVTTIVNSRYVRNYAMTNSFIEAFNTYLPIGKYPIGIINLTIDPLLIDVNIHPAKTEIKISIEDDIAKLLYIRTKEKLEELVHIPTRSINENIGYVKENIFNYTYSDEKEVKKDNVEVKEKSEVNYISPIITNDNSTSTIIKDNTDLSINEEKVINNKLPYMEYVGIVFATYLVFQNEDGMYLVDQHAAAERINYEKYVELLKNPKQPKTDLLVPILLNFTKNEAIYVSDNLDKFNEVGFELDQIGDNEFLLRGIPLWAKVDHINEIIYDILELLIENKDIDIYKYRDEIAKQISCKASIKANHSISRVEVDALIENLSKCKNPYTCPHGRPTIIKFTKDELEKMFERIQSK